LPDALWVAVHPGLVAIVTDREPMQFSYFGAQGREADAGLVGPTAYGLAATSSGLFVGTDDGLCHMASGRTSVLTDLGGVLPDNWVNDVRAQLDAVYVLTLRSGLMRLSPEGTDVWPTSLMTSPGVLLPLSHSVLFGTNAAGLAVLDRGAPRIQTYGPAQGLPSTLVTAILLDPETDRLWVGGSSGITRIDHPSQALGIEEPCTANLREKE
jgi:ligand-binding sensor domain-containing protein